MITSKFADLEALGISVDHEGTCTGCGRAVNVHQQTLGPIMIAGLRALASVGGYAHLLSLGLTNSEYCNFQKLRYWGLVDNPQRGYWQVTEKGYQFLRGEIAVPRKVETLDAVVIGVAVNDEITIHDVGN